MGAKPSPQNTETGGIWHAMLGTTFSANIGKEVNRFYFIFYL